MLRLQEAAIYHHSYYLYRVIKVIGLSEQITDSWRTKPKNLVMFIDFISTFVVVKREYLNDLLFMTYIP